MKLPPTIEALQRYNVLGREARATQSDAPGRRLSTEEVYDPPAIPPATMNSWTNVKGRLIHCSTKHVAEAEQVRLTKPHAPLLIDLVSPQLQEEQRKHGHIWCLAVGEAPRSPSDQYCTYNSRLVNI